MKAKNYVFDGPATDNLSVPYVLEKSRLTEANAYEFHTYKTLVPWGNPMFMTRAAVRKALLGPKEFRFNYKRVEDTESKYETGNRTSVAIRFGCTTFKGENYRRLRKWALAK